MKISEEKIIDFLFGQLDEAEEAEMRRLMNEDPSLYTTVNEYKHILNNFDSMPDESHSQRLEDHFDQLIENETQQLEELSKIREQKISYRFKLVTGIAASFLLAAFIGFQFMSGSGSNIEQESPSLDRLHRVSFSQKTSERISELSFLHNEQTLEPEVLSVLQDLLYTDPSTNVKLAIIESLAPHAGQNEVRELLLSSLRELKIPIVQIRIIEIITQTKNNDVAIELENLLLDEELDRAVQGELHVGLRELSIKI